LPPYASFGIDQIVLMGFSREEAIQALEETKGSVEDAVFLLTKTSGAGIEDSPTKHKKHSIGSTSASVKSVRSERSVDKETGGNFGSLNGIEVKCNCLSLCVIDDCKDSDVPVVEISVQQLELYQNCIENLTSADCVLTGDYYNRILSGWEPFLEPWKCNIKWKKNLLGQLGEF
jgi:hypothetical protein